MNYIVIPTPMVALRDFIESNHYSHNINGLKFTAGFGLYDKSNLIGAVLYGGLSTTSWKRYAEKEVMVVELRRVVLLDYVPRNAESWFISRTLKLLPEHCELVVSYADPYYGHVGYIYQALNFFYLGVTNNDVLLRTPAGRLYHSRALRTRNGSGSYKPFVMRLRQLDAEQKLERVPVPGKHIYVYPLNKKQRHKFRDLAMPYPKQLTEVQNERTTKRR